LNGENAVQVDRGRWLYRFVLDSNNVTMYRGLRSGQGLASPEVWRCVALLGVSDVLVVEVTGGWQPFVEIDDGRHHWALAPRASLEDAKTAAQHFLATLANAVAGAAQFWAAAAHDEGTLGTMLAAVGDHVPAPEEGPEVAEGLAWAKREREAKGWELVYRRDRVAKAV
jgi:hypothetical protein